MTVVIKWQQRHFNKLTNENWLQWFALVGIITQEEADNPYWRQEGWCKGLTEDEETEKFKQLKKDMKQKKKDFVPLWDSYNKSM